MAVIKLKLYERLLMISINYLSSSEKFQDSPGNEAVLFDTIISAAVKGWGVWHCCAVISNGSNLDYLPPAESRADKTDCDPSDNHNTDTNPGTASCPFHK